MRAIKGRVENGRVVIDEDGVDVDTETLAMLDERMAEADRGELVDGVEVIRRLREHQYAELPPQAHRSRRA